MPMQCVEPSSPNRNAETSASSSVIKGAAMRLR
jgi:hypothetical protein